MLEVCVDGSQELRDARGDLADALVVSCDHSPSMLLVACGVDLSHDARGRPGRPVGVMGSPHRDVEVHRAHCEQGAVAVFQASDRFGFPPLCDVWRDAQVGLLGIARADLHPEVPEQLGRHRLQSGVVHAWCSRLEVTCEHLCDGGRLDLVPRDHRRGVRPRRLRELPKRRQGQRNNAELFQDLECVCEPAADGFAGNRGESHDVVRRDLSQMFARRRLEDEDRSQRVSCSIRGETFERPWREAVEADATYPVQELCTRSKCVEANEDRHRYAWTRAELASDVVEAGEGVVPGQARQVLDPAGVPAPLPSLAGEGHQRIDEDLNDRAIVAPDSIVVRRVRNRGVEEHAGA